MAFLDVNAAVGRFARPGPAFLTAESLQAEMARLGIAEALVHHALAAEADIVKGNALLQEALRGRDNLYPCWVMAPAYLGDLPDPETWVAQARGNNVRAVRLFPSHGLYSLDDWCVGPLLRELERAAVPVLFDFGPRHWSQNVVPWGKLGRLAARHPNLPVVVVGPTVGDARRIATLLPTVPNLYLECHALMPPDMLEQFAMHGLQNRLLFGTGLPQRAAECPLGQTLLGGLGMRDLEAVAGGTARRLLGIPKTDSGSHLAREAAAVEVPVIDVHAHVGSWERTATPLKTPQDFVRSMDRCGIQKLVFSSFSAIHGETRLGNTETAEALRQFPSRLYGYCVVNPHDPEGTRSDLDRHLSGGSGFVGLKLHCGLHGVQVHDPGYEHALAFADERDLPVLVHGGGQDDWDLVCARYPRAAFIMAHACGWDGYDPAGRGLYARVRHTPNLYVDVAGSANHRGALRALIDLIGAEKILYGSDFPMFDLAWQLARIILSDIAPEQKRLICGDNARRLFKRIPPT